MKLGTCDDEKNPHELEADCTGWTPLETPKTYADGVADGMRRAAEIAESHRDNAGSDGMSEEAVLACGHSANQIASDILASIPVAERTKK